MTKPKFDTREAWLMSATEILTKTLFVPKEYTVPAKLRVTCGWPSSRALSKKRAIGECWTPKCSADGTIEIFLSPWLSEPTRVLDVLVHELCHAVVGNEHKHDKVFGKCARAMGLEGKLTATVAGAELLESLKGIAEELWVYPHAQLDKLSSPTKKQTTRMIKCVCDKCGDYTVRMSRKWIDEVGAPICPLHKIKMTPNAKDLAAAGPGDEDEDEDGGEGCSSFCEEVPESAPRHFNQSAIKAYALKCSAEKRAGKFDRVGSAFYDRVEAMLNAEINQLRAKFTSKVETFGPVELPPGTTFLTGIYMERAKDVLEALMARIIQTAVHGNTTGQTLK